MAAEYLATRIIAPSAKRPLLVMTAMPLAGHILPTIHVARELIKRGFEVAFLFSPEFKPNIESIGAHFHETTPGWPEGAQAAREALPAGLPRLLYDMEHIFIAALPARSASLRALLENLAAASSPCRDVVIVAELCSMAVLPFQHGAPLPKGYAAFPKVVSLNFACLPVTSDDTAPFGLNLPPDATPSGRARNRALTQLVGMGPMAGMKAVLARTLESLGCALTHPGLILDAWCDSSDVCFQMCHPALEYPRSDLHPSIRCAGGLPKKGLDPNYAYPPWWGDITANAALPASSPDKKKLVVVTQGTLAVHYPDLILPTIKALSPRPDILLLVILGVKNATLPLSDTEMGSNVHITDYLPYDAALQHADCFVTNGGYGSVQHAVNSGVPLVIAGVTEDKGETAGRAEHAGMAVDLKTSTPSVGQIAGAVDAVLGGESGRRYRERAVRLMRENGDLDSITIIEKQIWAFARGDDEQ